MKLQFKTKTSAFQAAHILTLLGLPVDIPMTGERVWYTLVDGTKVMVTNDKKRWDDFPCDPISYDDLIELDFVQDGVVYEYQW